MGRKGEIFYIGNGINIKDFPIRKVKKDKKTILVEGWEATNPSKDYYRMAHKACMKLKKQGFKINTVDSMLKKATFLNHNDHGLSNALKDWLIQRFPKKSKWEK